MLTSNRQLSLKRFILVISGVFSIVTPLGLLAVPSNYAATVEGTINTTKAYHDGGHNYIVSQEFGTPADMSSASTRSVLRIFENGQELSPAHSAHVDIRSLGKGRFSHWSASNGTQPSQLYFSASDNTNPRFNGRTYTYLVDSQVPDPTSTPTTPPVSPPTITPIVSSVSVNGVSAPIATAPGGTLTVGIQNGGTATAWAAMYKTTDANYVPSNFFFMSGTQTLPTTLVTSMTVTVTAPATAGTYEFRLFANNIDFTQLAISPTITVASTVTPPPPPPPPPPVSSGYPIGPQPIVQTPLAKGTLVAAPNGMVGSGWSCTAAVPCSLGTVTGKAIAGDVVFLRGGVYPVTQSIYFSGAGQSGKPITFESYPGELAILDGSGLATGTNAWVRITGSWNVLRRIEIRNMPQDGLFISGTHNVVDGVNAHHNRMTGIHIYSDYAAYPYGAQGSYNTIQNSTANDNSDVGQAANGGNADGIAISSGEGNKVLNCLAARNSDDGIDTWRSTNTEIAYSIATGNGLGSGDGNGIKAGSGTQPPASNSTVVHHSISYKNRQNGIDANAGTGARFSYNTSWANGAYGFVLSNGSTVDHGISLGNSGHVIGSGASTVDSWQRAGTVGFISTDPASDNLLRPTAGGGFEDIGALVP